MALQRLQSAAFDGKVDGQPVGLYVLRSPHLQAAFCNHGARLLELIVPDRQGQWRDVVLGYDSLPQLLAGLPSMGALIGRYANRIGGARFVLDGQTHRLPANDGPHCVHGGPGGSRHRVLTVQAHTDRLLRFHTRLGPADDGFPGQVDLLLDYTLEGPTLVASYAARVSQAATPLSLTCHPFFNLEGAQAGSVLDHELQILAEQFVPVDAGRIPLGHLQSVAGTAFDFRQARSLRAALAQEDGQLRLGAAPGFDHAFAVSGSPGALRLQARLQAPASGIAMEVWSDAPSLQFYSGAALDGSLPRHAGKHGQIYGRAAGLCLEPQQFPDAPNQPGFPACIHRPGELVQGRIEYRFGTF